MKQPYIYTLPEQFLEDQSVPARWRVWAVLNGFFLNNQKCWASNEWMAEKIDAHKDTVSNAVKELEDMGMILCERTRRSRHISPILKSEIGTNAYQEQGSTPISDRRQRLSISDSNSVSIITESSDSEGEYVQVDDEGYEIKKKGETPNLNKTVLPVFAVFKDNPAWASWATRPVEREAALILFNDLGLEEISIRYKTIQKHREKEYCPQIWSPSTMLSKMKSMEKFLKDLQA